MKKNIKTSNIMFLIALVFLVGFLYTSDIDLPFFSTYLYSDGYELTNPQGLGGWEFETYYPEGIRTILSKYELNDNGVKIGNIQSMDGKVTSQLITEKEFEGDIAMECFGETRMDEALPLRFEILFNDNEEITNQDYRIYVDSSMNFYTYRSDLNGNLKVLLDKDDPNTYNIYWNNRFLVSFERENSYRFRAYVDAEKSNICNIEILSEVGDMPQYIEPSVCGDSLCDEDENNEICPSDCPIIPNTCGDDICQESENNEICPSDCPILNSCGNGVCEEGENSDNCPYDCKDNPLWRWLSLGLSGIFGMFGIYYRRK